MGQRRAVGSPRASVLNAFRHRGKEDSSDPLAASDPLRPCSTPFGIEARRTRWTMIWWRWPGPAVLNAFRHRGKEDFWVVSYNGTNLFVLNAFRHRGKEDSRVVTAPGVALCSTPFGIEARRTGHEYPEGKAETPTSAQRLSASRQGGPPTARSPRPSRATVLNAFRHRGKEDKARHKCHNLQLRCAQRLSASRQGGQAARRQMAGVEAWVCSTPFGIEARRTQCAAIPK